LAQGWPKSASNFIALNEFQSLATLVKRNSKGAPDWLSTASPADLKRRGLNMKYLRYLALLGALVVPFSFAQAQVRVGIGIGFGGYGPGYVSGPPSCPYGYYPDYPYGCAPYGYYGSSYFVDGVFIGAGPWYHGYGRRYYSRPSYYSNNYSRGYYDRGYNDRNYYGRGDHDRDDRRYYGRGDYDDHRGWGDRGHGDRDRDDRGHRDHDRR
jgi:hypothetical protein